MKKFLTLLLTCAVATAAHALTFSSETFNYETVSSDEVKITGLTTKGKTLTSIMIYAGTTYDGTYYHITEIADGAFKNNDAFTTCNMTPAAYLTRIGDEAFMNTRVSTVATPAKVIGTRAFYGSRLSSIDLQDGVQEIGSYAFSSCSNLTSLSIPSTVTSIAQTSFVDNCINLTEIVVDTKNTKYASYLGMLYSKSFSTLYCCPAAYDGINLYQSSFKPNVAGIGQNAFKGNRTIKSIHLPYGVLTVGNEAFAGAVVEGVWMPSTMLSFGKDVFSNCGSLKDVGINASTLPYFNDYMMRNAPAQATLHVPYSAINSYKGTGKFSGWTITNGSYDIGTDINSNSNIRKPHSGYTVVSTKAETIDGVQYQGRVRYDSWYPKWGSTELKIAASVTFNNKKYIVTSVGQYVVDNYSGNGGSGKYKVTLGANVDTISTYAFYGEKQMNALTLSPNVTYVGNYAFANTALASDLYFSYGLKYVGAYAFSGTPIKNILIPSSCRSLHYYFVAGTQSLENLYINYGYPSSYQWGFNNVNSSAKLHVPAESIANYNSNTACRGVFASITRGAYDFSYRDGKDDTQYHMTVLSSTPITVDGVNYAGKAKYVYAPKTRNGLITAFQCSDFETDETNGANKKYLITEIGDMLCFNVSKINKVTLPNYLVKINDDAFYGTSITEIELPEMVESIGMSAFWTDALTSITSHNIIPPTTSDLAFATNTYEHATLYVPAISVDKYKTDSTWKKFFNIKPIGGVITVTGDVDGNGIVDISDANILLNIVLGKDTASKYDGRADVDGNGIVDITDVNATLNIVLGK
ncbi:MAG: leucine-rich repeat protein [Bacteroidales bacterium]|nr:leucine-rich repeat protein [Candidatus Sodaliphilus limicaballi]